MRNQISHEKAKWSVQLGRFLLRGVKRPVSGLSKWSNH